MADRSKPPVLQGVGEIRIPAFIEKTYDNGLRLFVVDTGVQEAFKLEVVFDAGRFKESHKLAARTTSRMLREGTRLMTANQLSEAIDFHGASLNTPANLDANSLVMYGLNKHFDYLVNLLGQVISEPLFPETEFKDYVQERKERLQLDLSKVDVLAYRTLTESLYGSAHPYGYNSSAELYDALGLDAVKQHYLRHYWSSNCTIFLSGKIDDSMIKRLESDLLPRIPSGESRNKKFTQKTSSNKQIVIKRQNALQTAVRVGCRLFNRTHPDFNDLYFLNIILGDYFSSRLMMNIREDKGYTYNIYSMMDIMRHDGMLIIGTETDNKYVEPTLKEIGIEFDKLRTDLISEQEMNMARNYTLGTFLSALDGPFNTIDVIKTMVLNDVDMTFLETLIDRIRYVESKDLRDIAGKYLQMDNMHTVLVGNL